MKNVNFIATYLIPDLAIRIRQIVMTIIVSNNLVKRKIITIDVSFRMSNSSFSIKYL